MNRLLVNMKNNVDTIYGAINQCKRLMNNETIVLNGLHPMNITRGDSTTDADLQNIINELEREAFDLNKRIYRMGK